VSLQLLQLLQLLLNVIVKEPIFTCGDQSQHEAEKSMEFAFWKISGINEDISCDVELFICIRTVLWKIR